MPTYSNGALNATVATVKTGGGKLRFVEGYNPNASDAYIQIFDSASTVTLGTTVPTIIIPIPATTIRERWFIFGGQLNGREFLNGLKIAATTTPTGSSAPSTALVVGDLEYT